MHSRINCFLCFFLLVLLFNPRHMRLLQLSSCSKTKLFDLKSLSDFYLTFLGDAHIEYPVIALTKEDMRSAGVVLYRHPILFIDPYSKQVSSFYTMFTFSIQNMYGDRKAFGDGLTFFISPNDDPLGSPGYLGLVDSTHRTRNRFVAIEFDTKRDFMFQDPDDNHVGLDIDNLFSVKLATSSSLGLDLKSGNLITAWIEYKGVEKRLEVFLTASNFKPKKPLLNVNIDLSNHMKENMFVGFSAAAEGSMQVIHIEQWEFTITEFSPPPPPPSVSVSRTYPNPSESGHRHGHFSSLAIFLAIGVCSVPFVLLFGWFCWKKLTAMIQKPEATNNLEMQTIRLSGGISCQDILLSILVDEVVKRLNIEKVLNNEAERVRVKTVRSSVSLCNSLPAECHSI